MTTKNESESVTKGVQNILYFLEDINIKKFLIPLTSTTVHTFQSDISQEKKSFIAFFNADSQIPLLSQPIVVC